MRRLLALLALATLACGGDTTTAPPAVQSVAVTFKVDAQTCSGSATLNLFIDGNTVGSETLTAGGTSKAYQTTASSHILGAAVANTGGRTWGPSSVNLAGLGTYTHLLICS